MADPLEFRNVYKSAASVKATRISTDGFREVREVAVRNSGGTQLGSTVTTAFVGPFASSGITAIGPRLLDLEVVTPGAWTYTSGDNTWAAAAYSQRA